LIFRTCSIASTGISASSPNPDTLALFTHVSIRPNRSRAAVARAWT
jgi:hypothetical protein